MPANGLFVASSFVVVERKSGSGSWAVCGWAEENSDHSTQKWYLYDTSTYDQTQFRARASQQEEDDIRRDSPTTPTFNCCVRTFTSDPSDRMHEAELLADGCGAISQVWPGTHPVYDESSNQTGTVLMRDDLTYNGKSFKAEWWLLNTGYVEPPSGTRTERVDHSNQSSGVDPNDTTTYPFPSGGKLVIVVWQ
jgi:hypothetical protein